MTPRRLSILGVGLLGGSLGLAVRERLRDCAVVGYSHRPSTLERARALGILTESHQSARAAVRGADMVVLCTPVGTLAPLLAEIAGDLEKGAIVTDVGSTKRTVVESAERLLPPGSYFVGSHPMAGSEKRGLEFASPNLFAGAVCITTPTPLTDSIALDHVESFWKMLGMTVTRISPARHDQMLADVSHLPHALAAALVLMQEDQALELCGKGFLDLTRIAGGDAGLWRDILLDNHQNLRQSLKRLMQQLDHLHKLLDPSQSQALLDWLSAAAVRRQKRIETPRPPQA